MDNERLFPLRPLAGIIAIVAFALSCAPADEGAGDTADSTASAGAATTAEARVPLAPTAADSLPAAILGEAQAPRGTAVAYFASDSATRGYIAVPEGPGPFPAVILIHEWNGLVDRVKQMADALAAEGYVAFAADLYSGRTGSSPEENMALVREVMADSATVIANLDAAVQYLRSRPDVSGRIATIGWCFGGGIALSYALGGVNHDGTAMFYGSLITDTARLRALHHPLYGTFAGQDPNITPEKVSQFVAALRSIGIENDIHVYDDVGHGFWLYVDQDPATRRAPALDAWQRLKAYLARTLGTA